MTTASHQLVVPNLYNFVLDRLAVGSYAARFCPGWAAIVSVGSRDALQVLEPLEAPCFPLPLRDGVPGLQLYLKEVCTFIHTHIQNGCVLVHCAAGQSRSVAVVVAYLVFCGCALQEAVALVKDRRPGAAPYPGFLDEISIYFRLRELANCGPRF